MFAGAGTLVRLILRRDRIKLPIWTVSIVGLLLAMIPMLRDVYGDEAGLVTLYQAFGSNPAGLFITGPMDAPTFGALMTIETLLWWGLAVAFMNTLLVVRHTRQNEERGAQELILSGQVHRSASLVAVLIVSFLINAVIAVGLGLGMSALETSWSVSQAWLFAISIGLFGLAWSAIAAIVVQLVQSSRSANGILAGLIGGSFVIRGIGDFMSKPGADGLLQPAWISWLSPFGWMQATRPLTYPSWWPVLVPLGFIVIALPIAFFMLSKRDVGAGILPARSGRARASAFLQTPLGYTWYMQKNVFIGWLIGVLVLAATVGALVPEMTSVYESSDSMKDIITAMGGSGAIVPSFLSAMLSFAAILVLAYTIHGLGKLRSEETSGHLESLLATQLSRRKWLGLQCGMVLVLGSVMLAISGAVLAVCVNLASSYQADVLEYTIAGLSYVPTLLLLGGLYVLLFGVLPRAGGVALWVYYGFIAFMSWLGPILKVDQAVMNLSVITHLAAAPAQAIVIQPLIIMVLVGAASLLVGSVAFQGRDLRS